jgi:hypothetical protein
LSISGAYTHTYTKVRWFNKYHLEDVSVILFPHTRYRTPHPHPTQNDSSRWILWKPKIVFRHFWKISEKSQFFKATWNYTLSSSSPSPRSLRTHHDLCLVIEAAVESLVTLSITGTKNYSSSKLGESSPKPPDPPPLSGSCQLRLDLPLNLEECHGKFGDASYHRNQKLQFIKTGWKFTQASLTQPHPLGRAKPVLSFLWT